MRRREKLRLDQRGAVAFEMPFVMVFLFLIFIIPIADFTVLGYNAIKASQALRDVGQYLQYHPPNDVTVAYTLPPSVATIGTYQISNPTITCGVGPGCPNAASLPKYYTFTTSFTIAPSTVMRTILCRGGDGTSCTYTLTYSERFQ